MDCVRFIVTFARRTGAALAAVALFVAPAAAQESADEDVSPNMSVADRFAANFGALGIKTGGFTLFPALALAGIYDDNIYSESTAKTDDFIADIAASLRLRSDWSVHALELFTSVRRLEYLDNGAESATEYTFGATGHLDIAPRARTNFRASHRRATEPRRETQTVIGAVEPVRFSTTTAGIDFDIRQNRFREAFGFTDVKDDFDDVGLVGGGVADLDFRDREMFLAFFRQYFRLRPTVALFMQIEASSHQFGAPQPGLGAIQDSKGYRASGGIAFDINKVARGEIGVGYQKRNFEDPIFADISGFNVDAKFEYFVTDLTTVTITADRSIRDTAIPGVAGYYSTGGVISVEHELFRPLLLVADFEYRVDDFRGLDREDRFLRASAGVDYAFRRNAVVSLRYMRYDISSKGAAARPDFDGNMLRFGVEFRL